jgi:hypothetical protein
MATTVPMLVEESGGIARSAAGIPGIMRHVIAVPTAVGGNIFNINTARVRDIATGLTVPAQHRILARYGGGNSAIGGAVNDDASRPARIVHVRFFPEIGANAVKNYEWLDTGGTGNTGASMVTQTINHYVVNTGAAIFHVPRTGPMSILRFAQFVGGETWINGDGGGLWIRGTAGEGQAADYYSRFDSSGDGTRPATLAPTESPARPSRYFTEVTEDGPLVCTITVWRVRLFTQGGTAFVGKGNAIGSNTNIAQREVYCDLRLRFFKGSAVYLRRVVNLSTGGGHGQINQDVKSDVSIDGFGWETQHAALGGTDALLATRDEGAAGKYATATATANATLRQAFGGYFNNSSGGTRPAGSYISGASYGFTIDEVGPFTLASATTQLESGFDVSATNGRGQLEAAWNFMNRAPMGWTYDRASGTSRWEILRPGIDDVARTNVGHHKLLGFHWLYAESWAIPHAAALTAQQRVDRVRAFAGRHEYQENGAHLDSTVTVHPIDGTQIPTLIGRCSAASWNTAKAWWAIPPPIEQRTAAAGMLTNVGGQLSYAPIAGVPGANRYEQANHRYDKRMQAWVDAGMVEITGPGSSTAEFLAVQTSFRRFSSVPDPAQSGPGFPPGSIKTGRGWRHHGTTGGSATSCAPNDYGQAGYPFTHWLSTGNREFFALGWEAVLHQVAIDLGKMTFNTVAGIHSRHGVHAYGGRLYHAEHSEGAAVLEFQQATSSIAWAYALTGEEMFREALDYVVNYVRSYFFGEKQVQHYDARNRFPDKAGVASAGSDTITGIADTSDITIGPGGAFIGIKPFVRFAPQSGWSSEGNVLRCTTINVGGDGKFFWSSGGSNGIPSTNNDSKAYGMRIQYPAGGPTYEVTRYAGGLGGALDPVRFEVKPTPPALANQTATILDWITNSGVVFALSKTATTIRFGSGSSPASAIGAGPVTVYARTSSAMRELGWPLDFMVCMCRLFGHSFKMAQEPAGVPLFEHMWHMTQMAEFSEQSDSSPGAIAQMGGLGTTLNSGEIHPTGVVHGAVSEVNATSTDYIMPPARDGHQFADDAAGWGYAAIFTTASRARVLQFLRRYCQFMFMGVDDLSPIESGGDMLRMAVPLSIPMARGGDVRGPTSYHMVAHSQKMAAVELPTAPGRTGIEAFRTCGSDLTRLSASPEPALRFGGSNFTGNPDGKGGSSADQICSEILIYVAEKLWNAPATLNIPKRNAYARKAIQAWIDGATFPNTETGGALGLYHNPNRWGAVFGGGIVNGSLQNNHRSRCWLLNGGAPVMLRVRDGWGAAPTDLNPPSTPTMHPATAITTDGASLSWTLSVDDVDPAPTYRLVQDGIALPGVLTATSLTVTGLPADTDVLFKVRAVDNTGKTSNDSNEITVHTLSGGGGDTTPPSVPTNLDGTTTTTAATLTFTGSEDNAGGTGVKQYRVERDGVEIGIVLHPGPG